MDGSCCPIQSCTCAVDLSDCAGHGRINLPFIDRTCAAKYKFLSLKNNLLVCPDFHRLPQVSDIDLNGNLLNSSCPLTVRAFVIRSMCTRLSTLPSTKLPTTKSTTTTSITTQPIWRTKEPSTVAQTNNVTTWTPLIGSTGPPVNMHEYANFTPSDH